MSGHIEGPPSFHEHWIPSFEGGYFSDRWSPPSRSIADFDELFPPLSDHDFFRFLRIASWNLNGRNGGSRDKPIKAL